MSLGDRLEQLEPRERRLLSLLLGLFAGFALLLIPLGIFTLVGSKQAHNASLHEAVMAVQNGREKVRKRELERASILERYAKRAPELAGFLETLSRQNNLEIPESQLQPPVPHGAEYDEKPTKIVFRRVGMLPLAKFMEGIAQSGYPVVISRVNIRKRAVESDSYDVEMVVSAFERKVKEKKPAKASNGAAGAKGSESLEGAAEL